MELVRRTVVFAGVAALGVSLQVACASGDEPRPGSTGMSTASASSPGAPDSAVTAGGVTPSASPAATPVPVVEGVSVMTGVYTAAQAARGEEVYIGSCAQCHTMTQHSGSNFAAVWNNRRVYDLYDIVHSTMPVDNPGGLAEQEYIDVIAYILKINGAPPGKTALGGDADALKSLRIEVKPSPGA